MKAQKQLWDSRSLKMVVLRLIFLFLPSVSYSIDRGNVEAVHLTDLYVVDQRHADEAFKTNTNKLDTNSIYSDLTDFFHMENHELVEVYSSLYYKCSNDVVFRVIHARVFSEEDSKGISGFRNHENRIVGLVCYDSTFNVTFVDNIYNEYCYLVDCFDTRPIRVCSVITPWGYLCRSETEYSSKGVELGRRNEFSNLGTFNNLGFPIAAASSDWYHSVLSYGFIAKSKLQDTLYLKEIVDVKFELSITSVLDIKNAGNISNVANEDFIRCDSYLVRHINLPSGSSYFIILNRYSFEKSIPCFELSVVGYYNGKIIDWAPVCDWTDNVYERSKDGYVVFERNEKVLKIKTFDRGRVKKTYLIK
jgi:hypothetical protein